MEIDETINKWHEETLNWIEKKIGPNKSNADESDKLCICAVATCNQYCAAILKLLHNDCEYPAKALMRCLGELNAKLAWSLTECQDNKDNTPEAVIERIRRWIMTANSKGIKLLEESKEVMRPEDKEKHEKILSDLKKSHEEYKKSNIKEMPTLVDIFKQLGDLYYNEIRPAFYSIFNDAVHLDPASMSAIYGSLPQGRDELETYCVAFAYNINSLIRLRYDLDTKQIKKEYDRIMRN